jgi:hypothetical protein
MMTMPEWMGAAVLGALIALFGWVGKQIADWYTRVRAEESARRARLVGLLALIRAGDVAFQIQSENRDRLEASIYARDKELAGGGHGYDKLFAIAFPDMTDAEHELHHVIRAITVYTIQPLNESLLKWLSEDVEFRVRPPGQSQRAQLAKYLTDLEAHLLLWQAKFKAWIPERPERALVYLADEETHGIGFPKHGAKLIGAILNGRRRIGA